MREVAGRLGLTDFGCPVITVGGTNGKGSSVAYLESMLLAQPYRVCTYTSPHLLRYNERIRVNGHAVADEPLCAAFEAIERVRGDVSLTYFEFGTLAALWLFRAERPDVIILEVGLGGRLDAVNLVDADVALIVSIGIDHTDWLGPDRESIGREKAGIFREGRPAVCGDPAPPASILQHAEALGLRLDCIGRDFRAERSPDTNEWNWAGRDERLDRLPLPGLVGQAQLNNAASSIAALRRLSGRLPVSPDAIREGLVKAFLPGRFQVLPGQIPVILDVAHNAEACAALADNLSAQPCTGRTLAVFGMLRDKPAREVARVMDAHVHAWYLAELECAGRGQSAESLAQRMGKLQAAVTCHPDVAAAFTAARRQAVTGDRIVVFGSFHTVEAVLGIAG